MQATAEIEKTQNIYDLMISMPEIDYDNLEESDYEIFPSQLGSFSYIFNMLNRSNSCKDGMMENVREFAETTGINTASKFFKSFTDLFWNMIAETYDLDDDINVYSLDCPVSLLIMHILNDLSRKMYDVTEMVLDDMSLDEALTELDAEPFCCPKESYNALINIFPKLLIAILDEYQFSKVVKITKETICLEDFSDKQSLRKTDCFRKIYHTRSNTTVMSLDELKENYLEHNGEEFDMASGQDPFDESCISKDLAERFLSRLSTKDRRIVEMRMLSFTYEEIAEQLGYKTHSAVIKRLHKIEDRFRRFVGDGYHLDSYLKPEYRKT